MTHRARPRVRLTGGGPTWDERQGQKARGFVQRKHLSKKQRAALDKVDANIKGLRVALRDRKLPLARRLRHAAWDEIAALPPRMTREQRRDLYQLKLQIQRLEAQLRMR